MDGVRHRKQSDGSMAGGISGRSGSGGYHPPFQLIRKFLYCVAFGTIILIILVTLNNSSTFKSVGHSTSALDQVSVALGVQERVYAVIIDAGSTGSRVLAFTFFRSLSDNTLKLHDELWYEVKPGLSSYADDPSKGAESLVELLSMAKERIPAERWNSTPLVLKATAGLRLLPEHKATALLSAVGKLLDKSGFLTTENSVGIMDGRDEGIFSWFTVNYLMDHIVGDMGDTLVALDLGGGSTQITFVPSQEDTIASIDKDDLISVTLLQKNVNLFTHSFLGLGLMAAREAIFKHQGIEDNIVRSSCINPIIETKWDYGGQTYTVKGPSEPSYQTIPGQAGRLAEKRPIADYETCLGISMKVVKDKVQNIPKELRKREVIAFSYFFDRAMERGLIDPFNGGVVTVQEFSQAAKQTCEIPNTEQPFACLDLTFISAFLKHGYNLRPDSPIKLYKRIDGYEVSWGLGLAFHIINNGI